MDESLKIQVYAEGPAGKSAVVDAIVALLSRATAEGEAWPYLSVAATHTHKDQGLYQPNAANSLTPGEYLLLVRKEGEPAMSPVVQRLTLTVKAGVLKATAGWARATGLAHQAATVSIVNAGQRATPSSDVAQFSTINIVLVPRTEIVALASHNHFSRRPPPRRDGTRYLPFAEGRRHALYAKGRIDKGTLCTFVDCQARQIRVTVKNAQPTRRGWVTIHQSEPNPVSADGGARRPNETSDKELGIETFYDIIDSIGWIHPGTVIEAGIFGHGWVQGPIVWGTSDFSDSSTARWPGGGGTPKDLDARQKDFIVAGRTTPAGPATGLTVMGRYVEFRSAFHTTGSLRLWGCVHMNNVLSECRTALAELNRGTGRDVFFDVTLESGGRERATLDHIKRNVAQYVVSRVFGRPLEHGDTRGIVAYAGAAAQFLHLPVHAAPPGMGSNYVTRDGDITFVVQDAGENAPPFRWWRREFGADLELDDNYLNYTRLLSAPLPDPGYRTERHAVLVSVHAPRRAPRER